MNHLSRVGVDVDGVLADFNSAFIQRVIDVTGRDLFPARPFDIPCWNYPQHYGYTEVEVSTVWTNIKTDSTFWLSLLDYPQTRSLLESLRNIQTAGTEIYFITARPGVRVKEQTEGWLLYMGFEFPTVLISSAKGLCARALDLTHYIDDRWENVVDVRQYSPTTSVSLLTQPWNVENSASAQGVRRIASVLEFVQLGNVALATSASGDALRRALQGGRSL